MALGNITTIPDSALLDIVRLILSRPGPLTSFDRTELEQVNREFQRREPDQRNEKRREQYPVRRMRQRIQAALQVQGQIQDQVQVQNGGQNGGGK